MRCLTLQSLRMTDADPYRVRAARFLRSAPTLELCGDVSSPEVAFLGRSNVGKSSLLGELLSQPKLVKTSRTPGRTRAVNLFAVELLRRVQDQPEEVRHLTLADLPGYGYANVNNSERERMAELLSDYVAQRRGLVAVVQLFDLRHQPTRDDLSALDALRQREYAHVLVATKADKIARTKRGVARRELAKALGAAPSDIVLFSSTEHDGRADVWGRLWEHLT